LLLEVKKWGAISVAAHVIQEKGLLRAMQGGRSATAVWKNENLQACSISGKLDETPPEFLPILKNITPEYKRTRPIAIINAQDVSSPDDVSKIGAVTDIKMSALSVEGLRQAFIDPETRVRRYDQQPDKPHQEILAIRWQGGFLDGLELRFNANLNVLIGGRGTGKSTVVESIRYVLGIQPIGEEARRSHESLIRDVLKEATVVSILVRTHTPSLHDYCVERIVPNPPQVRELDGSVSALSPRDLLPGIEIYGQHEIAEMVRDRRKLTGLLRRFAPDETALLSRKQQLQVDLKRSRTRLVELRTELTQLDERLSALPGLRETLKHYKTAGIEEKLKDQALLIREERILTTVRERLEPLREFQRDLEELQEIDVSFITPSALKDLPAATTLQSLTSTIQKLSKSITAAAGTIRSAIVTAESEIAEVEEKWTSAKTARQAALEKALREMQKSSGTTDPASFGQLHKKITTLEPLQDRRALMRRDLEKLEKERIQLLASWEEAKAEHYRLLATAAKKLSRAVEWRVRLSVEQPSNRATVNRC
jgi:DNA repair ATPase RecN